MLSISGNSYLNSFDDESFSLFGTDLSVKENSSPNSPPCLYRHSQKIEAAALSAAPEPVFPACPAVILNDQLFQLYREFGSNIQQMANDSKQISKFLTTLLEDEKSVDKTISLFADKEYLTSVSLVINADITIKSLEKIATKFVNVSALVISSESPGEDRLKTLLKIFPNVSSLEVVNGQRICGKAVVDLFVGKQLHSLTLSYSPIKEEDLKALVTNHRELINLQLYKCRDFTLDFLSEITRPLSSLKVVEIEESFITDNGLEHLARLAQSLERISLYRSRKLTDSGFQRARFSSTLTLLDVADTNINYNGLLAVGANLKGLKNLNLHSCRQVRLKGFSSLPFTATLDALYLSETKIKLKRLQAVLLATKNLQKLSLSGVERITGNSFGLIRFPKTLKVLDVSDTMVTLQDLKDIATQCLQLNTVMIKGCSLVHKKIFNQEIISPQDINQRTMHIPARVRKPQEDIKEIEDAIFYLELD